MQWNRLKIPKKGMTEKEMSKRVKIGGQVSLSLWSKEARLGIKKLGYLG